MRAAASQDDPDAADDSELAAEERILRATTAAMAALDPAALTIKRICRAAGVTPPTLYYHYGSKDGLVAAAVERLVAEWLAAMDAAVSRDASLPAAAEQAISAWVATIVAPDRPLAVFAWATLLLADSSELARAALIRARDRGTAMIAEVLALHVAPEFVDVLARIIADSVIASAVQYELDRDALALRTRLEALSAAVRAVAVPPAAAGWAAPE